MQLIRNFKGHVGAVLVVFCLLVVQAFCDLSLPNYTSDIVDVGIQQSGVEDVATSVMSQRTHDLVAMMLEQENEELFQQSYDKSSDGLYELNQFGQGVRDRLNEVVAFPMVVVAYADQLPDSVDLDQALTMYQSGMIKKDKVVESMQSVRVGMDVTDDLMAQQALAAAIAEYEACGYDMSSVQMGYLQRVGLMMLGLAGIAMLANIAVTVVAARTGAQISRDLRGRVYAKVLSFSEREVNKFSAASLITRSTNDIQLIQFVSIMGMKLILYAPILAAGGIFMVAQTNLSMGWVIVLTILTLFALIAVLMAVAMPKFKMMQTLIDRVNLVSREILTGLPVIRAFGRESHEEERFDEANTALMKTQLFTNRAMTFMMPVMQLIMNLTSVAIVWIGGHYIDEGVIQTGDLIAFITYSMIVVMSFLILGMMAIMVPRASVAASRIREVLDCEPSIVDDDACRVALADGGSDGATVEFDDVSFAYSDDSADVLEHVSFTADAGKTTAIIGATGSGKSTIVRLIERFYDVREGSVRFDGHDVRKLSQQELRSQIGYAPQKAFLFSGSVQSNVAFSDPQMDDERRRCALEVAQAAEFVDAKEGGEAFEVSQGGTNVSGGQRQRLCIARALATEARLYLFDDTFSALDYKTDAKLRAELAERLGGKTVIIVAQRIATIMGADKIVVLDEGRVVGQGTHAELLQSCPVYREIAESQLSPDELAKGGDRR